ncbi:MAG: sigma-70 family RNA polymerase sigma factor, partial [Planctomycetota bacterium]
MESTEDLVRRHGDYLRRLALALVHDEATARDVEQETWRVALERRDARVERPREWLGGIARHVAWRRSREESRRAARERDVARPEGTEGSASLEWGDTLQAALRRLDEPHREAVVQRYLMDRPPREIARRTGVPLETVKSRLKRGLAAMRADLDRQHGGDRRAWAVGLAGAFDLSLEVPATGLVSRGAQPVPATSVPWITSLTMYAKLLASIAVVASVSVWAFDGFERSSPSKGDTILEAPLGDATPTPLARIDEIPPGREAGLQPERDSSFTAGDGEFALAMEFETRSLFGDPLPGVSVHVAPPNHPFVTVGTTDSEGRVEIRWPSRLPAMTVDVAFDLDGDDLAGVQRVTVSEGVVRRVVAQVDRRSVNDHAHRLVEGEARVAEEEPQRSAPQRGGARRYARRDIGFSTEPEIGILLSVPIIRGALVGLDVVAFDAFDDVTNDEPAQSSFIEGMIVDELGQPLPSYPVRFTTGDGPASAHVLTDD